MDLQMETIIYLEYSIQEPKRDKMETTISTNVYRVNHLSSDNSSSCFLKCPVTELLYYHPNVHEYNTSKFSKT